MATKQELATLRSEIATKQDLASVAKNVDVTALGRQMRDLLAMKDDVTVLTAIVQRLDNTMARQIANLLTAVHATQPDGIGCCRGCVRSRRRRRPRRDNRARLRGVGEARLSGRLPELGSTARSPR